MNDDERPGLAAGLTNPVARAEARERVLAFLQHWPGPHNDDEIYRLYAHGVEHSLRKSDILAALGLR